MILANVFVALNGKAQTALIVTIVLLHSSKVFQNAQESLLAVDTAIAPL